MGGLGGGGDFSKIMVLLMRSSVAKSTFSDYTVIENLKKRYSNGGR